MACEFIHPDRDDFIDPGIIDLTDVILPPPQKAVLNLATLLEGETFNEMHEIIVKDLWYKQLLGNPDNQESRDILCDHALQTTLCANLSLISHYDYLMVKVLRLINANYLLHDIGKIDESLEQPEHIIHQYKTQYTASEREAMCNHTRFGAEMLLNAGLPKIFADIAQHHHLRNGKQQELDLTGFISIALGLFDSAQVVISKNRSYDMRAEKFDPLNNLTNKLEPVIEELYHPELKELFSTFMGVITRDGVLEKIEQSSLKIIQKCKTYPETNPIDEVLLATNRILYPDQLHLHYLSIPFRNNGA
jgi:putative nucleotidyltransferase with HDIG domain